MSLFLRHNNQFSDLIVLIDNSSTDDTKNIAMETARELGNIIVTDFIDQAYNQSKTMSQALRYVQSAAFADFVFFLDADEFIQVESKDELLKSLSKLSPRSIGLMPWKTFIPNPVMSDDALEDPLDRITLLRTKEDFQFHKAVIHMAGELDPDLCVFQGNHLVLNAYGSALPSVVYEDIDIAHIPIRSSDQVIGKGAVGWRANLKRKDFKPDQGFHWRRFYEMAEEGKSLSPLELALEGLNYSAWNRRDTLNDNVIECRPKILSIRRFSDGQYSSTERLVSDYEHNTTLMTSPLLLPPPPSDWAEETKFDSSLISKWRWEDLSLDETPFRFLIDFFKPSSILDLGCGCGLYPRLYRHLGVETVFGVDKIPLSATVLGHESYIIADLQQPFDAGRHFDMVICLDVAQYISPEYTETFFDNVARNSKNIIIFSMAEPGQPGNDHNNCMNIADSLKMWADRGWRPDLSLTLGVRAISSLQSMRRNILVLRRGVGVNANDLSALEMIGRKKYAWYSQETGQRYFAFSEKYPALSEGYGSSFRGEKLKESLVYYLSSCRRAIRRMVFRR